MSGVPTPLEADAPPQWFLDAVEHPTTSHWCTSAGATIHYRTWEAEEGDASKQGLLFVHGGSAHSHWWDFIAPFFAQRYRVAAIDLAGMGDSEHRDTYSLEAHARELMDCCEDAGLLQRGRNAAPIFVGHSFGGWVVLAAARLFGDQLGGVVVVDSPVRSQKMVEGAIAAGTFKPPVSRPKRVYPTRDAIVGRFSLLPPQPCANRYIMDHIARHSIVEVRAAGGAAADSAGINATPVPRSGDAADDGDSGGYVWKFDDKRMQKSMAERTGADITFFTTMLVGLRCRLTFIYGSESALVTEEVLEYMREQLDEHRPGGSVHTPMVPIYDAAHHIMLDQPLAFISTLCAALGEWERFGSSELAAEVPAVIPATSVPARAPHARL